MLLVKVWHIESEWTFKHDLSPHGITLDTFCHLSDKSLNVPGGPNVPQEDNPYLRAWVHWRCQSPPTVLGHEEDCEGNNVAARVQTRGASDLAKNWFRLESNGFGFIHTGVSNMSNYERNECYNMSNGLFSHTQSLVFRALISFLCLLTLAYVVLWSVLLHPIGFKCVCF